MEASSTNSLFDMCIVKNGELLLYVDETSILPNLSGDGVRITYTDGKSTYRVDKVVLSTHRLRLEYGNKTIAIRLNAIKSLEIQSGIFRSPRILISGTDRRSDVVLKVESREFCDKLKNEISRLLKQRPWERMGGYAYPSSMGGLLRVIGDREIETMRDQNAANDGLADLEILKNRTI
jgi:hypothetical protein